MITVKKPIIKRKAKNLAEIVYPMTNQPDLIFTINSPDLDLILPVDVSPGIIFSLSNAIQTNQDINSKEPVDTVLFDGINHWQDRMLSMPKKDNVYWRKHLQIKKSFNKIDINVPRKPLYGATMKHRIGLFYSGGADSLYSLLTLKEVSDVVHIQALFMNQAVSERNLKLLRILKPNVVLHRVTVNYGTYLKSHGRGSSYMSDIWTWLDHGIVLASIGSLFSNLLTSIAISGTDRFAGSDCGSGRDIDYLFSSSMLRFMTFGLRSKVVKYKFLAAHPKAKHILTHMQSCPHPKPNTVNCSKCIECILNMLMLDCIGIRPPAYDFSNFEHKVEKYFATKLKNIHPIVPSALYVVVSEYTKRNNRKMVKICNEMISNYEALSN